LIFLIFIQLKEKFILNKIDFFKINLYTKNN